MNRAHPHAAGDDPSSDGVAEFLTLSLLGCYLGKMKTVAVAFLWHLHQPYYTDPLTHTAPFPWVRLHAAKGYFDMAVLLEEHPEMHVTVNITPSLLLQREGALAHRTRVHAHPARRPLVGDAALRHEFELTQTVALPSLRG